MSTPNHAVSGSRGAWRSRSAVASLAGAPGCGSSRPPGATCGVITFLRRRLECLPMEKRGADREPAPSGAGRHPRLSTSGLEVRPIAPESLVSRIVAEVRRRIIDGEFPPGHQLPTQSAMAAQFGVSQPLLREALAELRSEGFIETRSGRGSYVRLPSESDLVESFSRQLRVSVTSEAGITADQLYEARGAIETVAAELAATRATSDDLETLETLLHSMSEGRDDPSAFTAADVGFHVTVARAARNPLLPTLLQPLVSMIVEGVFESHSTARAASLGIADHKKILAALKKRDPAAARLAMSTHLIGSRRLFPEQVVIAHSKEPGRVSPPKSQPA